MIFDSAQKVSYGDCQNCRSAWYIRQLVEHLTYKQGIAGLNSALGIPFPSLSSFDGNEVLVSGEKS